jgi:hypothetical protein
MRAVVAHDAASGAGCLLLLQHHLASDHTTLDVLMAEIRRTCRGAGRAPGAAPVPQLRGAGAAGGEPGRARGVLPGMLGDVDEPTAPFGLLDAAGDGPGCARRELEVDASLAARLRERARRWG